MLFICYCDQVLHCYNLTNIGFSCDRDRQRREAKHKKLERLQSFLNVQEHNIATSTSKSNYLDPRITVAWCARVSLPLKSVYDGYLQDCFEWALDVPTDWRFSS